MTQTNRPDSNKTSFAPPTSQTPFNQPPSSNRNTSVIRLGDIGYNWHMLALFVAFVSCVTYYINLQGHAVGAVTAPFLMWMHDFAQPGTLRTGLTAGLFKAMTPLAYDWPFHIASFFGFSLVATARLLGFLLMGACVHLVFVMVRDLTVRPGLAFIAACTFILIDLPMGHIMWASPQGFGILCCLIAVSMLLSQNVPGYLGALFASVLLYPPLSFILLATAVVIFYRWHTLKSVLFFTSRRGNVILAIALMGILLGYLFYGIQIGQLGEHFDWGEANDLTAFSKNSQLGYFGNGFWQFWFAALFSGFAGQIATTPFPASASFGGLPFAVFITVLFFATTGYIFYANRSATSRQIPAFSLTLGIFSLVSAGLFLIAHIFAFALHWPSVYSSAAIKSSGLVGIFLCMSILLDNLPAKLRLAPIAARLTAWFAAALFALSCIVTSVQMPTRNVFEHKYKNISQFLHKTPRDTLVATLSPAAAGMTFYSRRPSILIPALHFPLFINYHENSTDRLSTMARAFYSPHYTDLVTFINRLEVDYIAASDAQLNFESITQPEKWPHFWWRHDAPDAFRAASYYHADNYRPVLFSLLDKCIILKDKKMNLIDAGCLSTNIKQSYQAGIAPATEPEPELEPAMPGNPQPKQTQE